MADELKMSASTGDLREQIAAALRDVQRLISVGSDGQVEYRLTAAVEAVAKVVAPLLAAKQVELDRSELLRGELMGELESATESAARLEARVAELTRERDACPCRPVQIHAQACERLDAQQELLVEALDDYQAESRGEVSWAGIAGTALAALAASGGRPAAQEAGAPNARGEGEEGISGRGQSGRASREDGAVQTVGTGYPQGTGPGCGAATPAPPSPRLTAGEAGEPPAPPSGRVAMPDRCAFLSPRCRNR